MKPYEITCYVNTTYKCIVIAEDEEQAEEISEMHEIDDWEQVGCYQDFTTIEEAKGLTLYPIFKE